MYPGRLRRLRGIRRLSRVETPKILFYDGHCGLCHGAVRFVLHRDAQGPLRFAPLQGETFLEKIPENVRRTLPDSLVLLTTQGSVLTQSTSVAVLLGYLGGGWGIGGRILGLIPRILRDGGYRLVAAIRHRVFKKPEGLCPIPPSEARPRFLP